MMQNQMCAVEDRIKSEKENIVRPIMPELDSIRGLAVLMVVCLHGFQDFMPAKSSVPAWERLFLSIMNLGWTGVNLFFVLSGFLITGILLDSKDKPQYYSRFYYHRVLRILPAYYLLIAVLSVVSRAGFIRQPMSWSYAGMSWGFAGLSLIYLSNIAPLLGVTMGFGPFWSLAVEEHFYLIWPTAVKYLKKKALMAVSLLICLTEPLVRVWAIACGGLWWDRYTWLMADGLAFGALLAIFVRSKWGSRKNLLKLAGLCFSTASIFWLISLMVPMYVAISLKISSVNEYALSVLAITLWIGTSSYRKLVNIRVLSFYGFISYGLYLVHVLIFYLYDRYLKLAPFSAPVHDFKKCLLRLVITLVVSTAVAYLCRTTYEEFFLQKKNKNFFGTRVRSGIRV